MVSGYNPFGGGAGYSRVMGQGPGDNKKKRQLALLKQRRISLSKQLDNLDKQIERLEKDLAPQMLKKAKANETDGNSKQTRKPRKSDKSTATK